jgi:hypothetical protein
MRMVAIDMVAQRWCVRSSLMTEGFMVRVRRAKGAAAALLLLSRFSVDPR